MDKETLITKLLDLTEGRETPESWRNWWSQDEPGWKHSRNKKNLRRR